MRLTCAECGAEFKPPQLAGRVPCGGCDAQLDLSADSVRKALALGDAGVRGLRITLEVGDAGGTGGAYRGVGTAPSEAKLTLRKSWVNPQAFVLVPITLFWNGFLLVWYAIGFSGLSDGDSMASIMACCFLVFPLLHVGLGIFLTYLTAAKLFNATHIRADREGMSVAHGPLPYWTLPSWTAQRDSLRQLMLRHQPGPRGWDGDGNWTGRWKLVADIKGEELRPVLRDLQHREEGAHIERLLEGFLGVKDELDASH